jgi:hypothetical protein
VLRFSHLRKILALSLIFISLRWKGLTEANTLAYFVVALATKKISLIKLTMYKTFFYVLDLTMFGLALAWKGLQEANTSLYCCSIIDKGKEFDKTDNV